MMSRSKLALSTVLALALVAPAPLARAEQEPHGSATTPMAPATAATPAPAPASGVWMGPLLESRARVVTNGAMLPRVSPFAPQPKPIMSEGAKAGVIAGVIVVAALIVTGVIIVHPFSR